MLTQLEFFVPGIAATAGSKTGFFNKKINRVIMVPANKKQKPWMAQVRAVAAEAYTGEPIRSPIRLECWFCFSRPKSHFGSGKNAKILKKTAPEFHSIKPDCTKLLRAVEDALTGVIWHDDCQIVAAFVRKFYGTGKPGVEIKISYEVEE